MDTLERNLAEQMGVSRYRWKEGYFCRGYSMRTGGVHKTSRFSTWVQDKRYRDVGMTILKLQFLLSDRHRVNNVPRYRVLWQVRTEGGLVQVVGGLNARGRGWPFLTPFGTGKPPEISEPAQHSTSG